MLQWRAPHYEVASTATAGWRQDRALEVLALVLVLELLELVMLSKQRRPRVEKVAMVVVVVAAPLLLPLLPLLHLLLLLLPNQMVRRASAPSAKATLGCKADTLHRQQQRCRS